MILTKKTDLGKKKVIHNLFSQVNNGPPKLVSVTWEAVTAENSPLLLFGGLQG